MQLIRVIGTATLFIFFGTIDPAYAQEKGKPEGQPQRSQQAAPRQQPQPQRAQQAAPQQQPQPQRAQQAPRQQPQQQQRRAARMRPCRLTAQSVLHSIPHRPSLPHLPVPVVRLTRRGGFRVGNHPAGTGKDMRNGL